MRGDQGEFSTILGNIDNYHITARLLQALKWKTIDPCVLSKSLSAKVGYNL